MENESSKLSADESWVIDELRKVKTQGFAEMVIKIHAGVAETITVEQKFKRMSGVRVSLKD
jgi:hypothetical protein